MDELAGRAEGHYATGALDGTVADGTTCPMGHRFVPVAVNVSRIPTRHKRAPGDISHTNIDFNPIETMLCAATPPNTSLQTTQKQSISL